MGFPSPSYASDSGIQGPDFLPHLESPLLSSRWQWGWGSQMQLTLPTFLLDAPVPCAGRHNLDKSLLTSCLQSSQYQLPELLSQMRS